MSNDAASRERGFERAAAFLEERFRPAAVLLYGSHAKNDARPTSDVDLAIVMGGGSPDPFAVASARIELEDLLAAPVDLVALDDASPILRMEVLRNCRALRKRDPEAFESFVVRTLGAYFDLKRVRTPIEKALAGGARG